jgi:hypothetical protein
MSESKRGRPRVTICKRGHDQTIEGARNAQGACIACNKIREAERKASLPPKVEKPNVVIPEETLESLLEIQRLSSKTVGATPLGHEYRRAGDLLAEAAVAVMEIYGVTAHALSIQMGLDSRTLSSFLQRRGAIPAAPSIERFAYKNETITDRKGGVGRPKLDACKWGHDLTAEGSRQTTGACRQCRRDRQNRYYHERKVA